jgi:histidinol-phosphate aminotransferase
LRFRKVLEGFEPYEWETPSGDIAVKLGLTVEQIVRFDTNASPKVPSRWLRDIAVRLDELGVNDYPDTSYLNLRVALSKYVNVPVDWITVTNGSDEGLDLLVKTFIDVGSKAVVSAPTYSFYKTVVQTVGGDIVSVPRLNDFSDDVESLLKAIEREDTRIVFLCSPNNPTGNSSKREDVIRLLEEATDVAVVVDEAYSEFSGKTLIDLTDRYDNLIVLRTFSKAFALAGARVGYTVASKSTIDLINKVRPPNSLNVISLALAELAANDLDTMKSIVEATVQERDRCRETIEQLKGIYVYSSETNFLLLRFEKLNPNKVHEELMKRGLIVRNVSKTTGLEKCLRFSVRLPEQNDRLLTALAEIARSS